MAAEKEKKINKGKLIRELLILGGIAIVIFLIGFLPWLAEQPIPGYDQYAKYQTLFETVQAYDYSNGRNTELESKLDAATSTMGDGPIDYYFDLKAKLYYYNQVGLYTYSNQVADEAMRYVPTEDEKMFVYSVYIENYRALGDEEKVLEYESYYDRIVEAMQ
ncbi:MAG: hypothetical protein ACK5MU_00630 [Candidatus Saccharimonadales bacterium]